MQDRGTGIKYDGGKPQARLPFKDFPLALLEVCEVSTMGANKYEAHNWRKVEDLLDRYEDALARHYLALGTERLDQESGRHHLAHMAWNCLALLQVELENEKDG